jgi:pentatricopeptide repeat protein
MSSDFQPNAQVLANGTVWVAYESLLNEIMLRGRVVQKQPTKATPAEISAAQKFLLLNSPLLDASELLDDNGPDLPFRKALNDQKKRFMATTGFNEAQYEYCARCLTYLGDLSAKRKSSEAVRVAWRKILEMGMAPRENCVSTYMFALSLASDTIDWTFDVASFHDRLFEPNEKTTSLRIKTFVARGDPLGAEEILFSLPDKTQKSSADEWKRLRTFQPLLAHYCDQGNVSSILRLFNQMRQSTGVHLDADTYSLILSSLAKAGCFAPLRTIEEATFIVSDGVELGPRLLDDICSKMSDDLLDLTEEAATRIWKAFISTESNEMLSNVPMAIAASDASVPIVGRVSVDDKTGMCRTSEAQLRLFALTADQRRHVHDTLLDMAAAQQREYGDKLKGQGKVLDDRNGFYAREELGKFSTWLHEREGEPFTAFVDGPNIGFYGHGTVHYSQIKAVVEALEQRGERPLVTMPSKYIAKSFWLTSLGRFQALDDRDLDVMNELLESGKMYAIPAACLDDYYWMIASVANQTKTRTQESTHADQGRFPGLRPLLVTNDQMRDHRLSLLEPREFRRWTSCHIVKYHIDGYIRDEWEPRQVTFFPADVFSREIQGNPHPGGSGSLVWHFPVAEWAERDRLCVYFPSV